MKILHLWVIVMWKTYATPYIYIGIDSGALSDPKTAVCGSRTRNLARLAPIHALKCNTMSDKIVFIVCQILYICQYCFLIHTITFYAPKDITCWCGLLVTRGCLSLMKVYPVRVLWRQELTPSPPCGQTPRVFFRIPGELKRDRKYQTISLRKIFLTTYVFSYNFISSAIISDTRTNLKFMKLLFGNLYFFFPKSIS